MAEFSQMDVIKILMNLDTLGAGHIPEPRRAWAHMFIALALLQRSLPDPEKLTRERFAELTGKIHDQVYGALSSGGPEA